MASIHVFSDPRWLSTSSPYNTAFTAWLVSHRMFADSCAWLGDGRFNIGLK